MLIRELELKGVSATKTAPPLFRFLWRLGYEIPPPLFLPFKAIALAFGAVFAATWGPMMWFVMGYRGRLPGGVMVALSISAGTLFGVLMGLWLRRRARQLGLPEWSRYPAA